MSFVSKVIPHLPAWQINGGSAVWCEHCGKYHYHGTGSTGHRLAHCETPDSPYFDTGYILTDAGPATAAILADINKPRRARRTKATR